MVHCGRSVPTQHAFGSLLISSPQGHSGKTVVTIGLCGALRRKGLSVQPFKKGPDYIDPSWLTLAADRSCRNLDLFLVPEHRLVLHYQKICQDADMAIVEGAMGLYDGFKSPESGTTAEIARLFKIPILLVVNTARMTSSIAAMVTGYQRFQPEIEIAGVILNYVSGSRHEQKLRAAVEQYCHIPVVGSIPRDLDLTISERHLGLVPSGEWKESESLVEKIVQTLGPHLDLGKILVIAKSFKAPDRSIGNQTERGEPKGRKTKKVRIGVIFDHVFHFYYPENLEALIQEGSELVLIDSLNDRLPDIDGLYIGGGFPEFFLEGLEANRTLRKEIRHAIEEGLPCYAECAGLMYLCQSILWQDRSYEMVGIIPAKVHVSSKPKGHGYVIAEVTKENPLFPVGMTVRGHEFHHSKLSLSNEPEFVYQIRRGQGIDGKRDGILYKNMLAAYTHIHALGIPKWAEAFVSLVSKEGRKQNAMTAMEA